MCRLNDEIRMLKRIPRIRVENFAVENVQKKPSKAKKLIGAAEGVRDAFGHLLAKIALQNEAIDLCEVLSFPITEVPLSLAHADGMPTKTEKANLTRVLEAKQATTVDEKDITTFDATLFDGGLVLHEVLLMHNGSTYGAIIRDIMIKICSTQGDSVHLLLDRCLEPSIKDLERLQRGSEQAENSTFIITSAEQQQRQKGIDPLKSGPFKEAFAEFLLKEVTNEYYSPIIGRKTGYLSHGGYCVKLWVNSMGTLSAEQPGELQGRHEEADTLIAFHVYNISGKVIVRSSGTDVLVILVGLVPKMSESSMIVMDFGSGNNRRLINVSDISNELEKKHSGLSEALIGFHAVTGCDFSSVFYRKGKVIPLSYLEKAEPHVKALQTLSTKLVNKTSVTAYICRIYGFKAVNDINEARFQAFVEMTGGIKMKDKVKKLNCSSLPPCKRSLEKHISRANYLSQMWSLLYTTDPKKDLDPLDFSWTVNENGLYVPLWFTGPRLPNTFRKNSLVDEEEGSSTLWMILSWILMILGWMKLKDLSKCLPHYGHQ